MNISKLFITRPVATLVLTFAIAVFGWIAYKSLPVSELPEIDFATIKVSANMPGAAPEVMANTVATPLEKQLSAISGIDSMSSVNTTGQTAITLQFNLDRDIDAAAQDVQAAVSATALPIEVPAPPSLRKLNPSASPIIYMAFTGDNTSLTHLTDIAENYIGQRLSMLPGIALVQPYGGQAYAIRIHLNPGALAARNLSNAEVISAIQAENVNKPAGVLYTNARSYTIKPSSPFTNAATFQTMIVGYNNGAPVRLSEVADVEDSVGNTQIGGWYNTTQRTIILAVQRQPNSNTVAVADAIHHVLPELIKKLPSGATLHMLYDRSAFIRAALAEMQFTLSLAIALVAIVILLFLGRFAPTLIAVLALPVSLLATFGIMYLCGYSLNTLSLMGLVLAVGFIVDDAIVMIENIVRYLEKGCSALQAALQGSEEIFFTIVSMTISLVAVFIPILFMGGLIGRLFHEFAIVVGAAILMSGIISLMLTPMLCAKLLRPQKTHGHSLFPWFEKLFIQSQAFYAQSLAWTLVRKKLVLIGTGIVLLLTGMLFFVVNKGFMPSEDTGIITGFTRVPVGLPFTELVKRQAAVAQIIHANPNVESMVSIVGQRKDGANAGNGGQIIVRLKPLSQRTESSDTIINHLRKPLQALPGIQTALSSPPAIQAGSATSSSNFQFVLQGNDLQQLQSAAQKFQAKLATIAGVRDVNSDTDLNNPEVRVKILYDRAAALGVTPAAIQSGLYNAFGQRSISTIYTATDEYSVLADVGTQYQQTPTALDAVYVRSTNGSLVPLSAVTQLEEGVGPVSINHYGQLPSVLLSFNLAPGTALGDVSDKIESLAHTTLPPDISGAFAGAAQIFKASTTSMPILLLLTIFVIYVVLAILYEHFIHPLTILTALPFASFGALFMLWLFHRELDIFSFVGIIMLIGLVKKNGIMMIDFAIAAQREQGVTARNAIFQASMVRFRPIMMTTLTAILATLPLALGMGAGAESRQPMGIAVVGGLLFSQLLTLYVTPVFYVLFDKIGKKSLRRR